MSSRAWEPRWRLRAAAEFFGYVAVILFVGWIDFITGPEVGLSLFYLVPIVAAAWRLGRWPGVVAALLASSEWLLADVLLRQEADYAISIWNGFTRFGIFITMALLIAGLRRDRDRMSDLNRSLEALAERESLLARRDPLTGLVNSRGFFEQLQHEVARSARAKHSLCVCYIDIDNFKSVNDRYGHAAGDTLLREIGVALREALRATDVAARLGGDEFGLLLWAVTPTVATEVAERVQRRVAECGSRYEGCGVDASIGLVHLSTPPADPDVILRRADAAMYRAKTAGRGRVVAEVETAGEPVAAVSGE